MSADKEVAYRAGLEAAVATGAGALERGEGAVAAVVAAVSSMEWCGVFNAGRGSCLNRDGQVEVDAAIMSASDARIGALAAVPGLGNPTLLADEVRRASPHCVLSGNGALRFGDGQGVRLDRFAPTADKLARYRELKERRGPGEPGVPVTTGQLHHFTGTHDDGDTVGAVALDERGEMAVAVSTGGLWLKHPGRVGDSPLPGAGFWAQAGVGVAVATGIGEYLLRNLVCRNAVEYMARGQDAVAAGTRALDGLAAQFGAGHGGLVTLDRSGAVGLCFDTQGMGRAVQRQGEPLELAVWSDEGVLAAP